jgi:hypothetical protein
VVGGVGGAVGAVAAGTGAFAAASMSPFVTRPPGPLPVTCAGSTPSSAAMRRTAGDVLGGGEETAEGAGVVVRAAAGAGAGAGAGVGCAFAGAGAGAFAGALALSSICPISSPTCTTSPSFFPCFVNTPALNAGTSTVILSVSSSTSDSFCATTSPSFFNHREIVASTIDSPSGGTLIEIIPPSSECRKGSAGTEKIALLAASLPLTIRYSI